MDSASKSLIAALDDFAPADDGDDEHRLYEILDRFNAVRDPSQVLPAIFGVMERHPQADLGAPGPLVHSVESLPVPAFLPLLKASVKKQPGLLNVWMINRILNSPTYAQDAELLKLLQETTEHSLAAGEVRDEARRFLVHQSQRM